jgi:hypothetical protein
VLEASDLRLQTVGSQTFLRFSTISVNVGAGALELRSGKAKKRKNGNARQRVYQRIQLADGSFSERVAGEFIYHRGHNHTHFEDYALYELLPEGASDALKRMTSKTSFCIIDTVQFDTSLPGAPASPVYDSCSDTIQGLSVGWGDRYFYGLSGQEIDITGLPDGAYVLRLTIDPKDRLQEADDEDNTSEVRFNLVAGTIRPMKAR